MKKSEESKERKTFGHALYGLIITIMTERNMKIHLLAAVLTIMYGIYIKMVLWKWAALILIIGLVMVAEMINTALEAAVDLFSLTYHPMAKKAKDTAAGAVLTAAIFAVVMGVIIFILPDG